MELWTCVCLFSKPVSIPSPPCSYVSDVTPSSQTNRHLVLGPLLFPAPCVSLDFLPFLCLNYIQNINSTHGSCQPLLLKSLLDIIFQQVLCSPSLDTRKTWAQRTTIYMIPNHLHYIVIYKNSCLKSPWSVCLLLAHPFWMTTYY